MADLMDGWEEDQEDDADGYGEPAPAVGGGMGDEDLEDDEGFDFGIDQHFALQGGELALFGLSVGVKHP